MNLPGFFWPLPAEAALVVQSAVAASLLLVVAALGLRWAKATQTQKHLAQAAAVLLCLLALGQWSGALPWAAGFLPGEFFRSPAPAEQSPVPRPQLTPARRFVPAAESPERREPDTAKPAEEAPRDQSLDRSRFQSPARSPNKTVGQSSAPPGAEVVLPALSTKNDRSARQDHPRREQAAGATVRPAAESAGARVFWPRVFLLGWLAGTVGLALWWVVLAACWRRRAAAWQVVQGDSPLGRLVAQVAAELGYRGTLQVCCSEKVDSPFACGWWRPRVVLPEQFAQRWSPGQQKAVLAHELAHLRHRDPFWLAVLRLSAALWWWHPGVWLLLRRWRWWAELAADDVAAGLSGTGTPLAEALLVAARGMLGSSRRQSYQGAVAFHSPLGNRIQRLLSAEQGEAGVFKKPSRWSVCCFVVVGLLVLAGPAAAIPAADPSWTGDSAMRTAPWWRRSALMLAVLGLTGLPAEAQAEPRGEVPPRPAAQPPLPGQPFRVREAPRREAARPHPEARRERPHHARERRHPGPSPEERLERLLRIAEELERLGLHEEAEHMRRRAEEFKEHLERKRHASRRPEQPGPNGPRRFQPRRIHRPEGAFGPPRFHEPGPRPPHAELERTVKEMTHVVRELREALHQTRRELEETRRHFQRELERTRVHLERVTERLERLERQREEEEEEREDGED